MSNIRKDVSRILGYTIIDDKWDEAFADLDRDGRISRNHIIKILLLLLKREEKRENG